MSGLTKSLSFLRLKPDDDARLINIGQINPLYPKNKVTNTKYTPFNFVFLNLMEQFSQHMNRYFLFIACLQLFHEITPVHPATTWVPLLTVLSLSGAKELIDDLGRHKRDKESNSKAVNVIRNGQMIQIRSEEVQVGDLVKINKDEAAVCDLCLLISSNDEGICFIQTSNLDGESNYKQRSAVPQIQAALEVRDNQSNITDSFDKLLTFDGQIVCNLPNTDIYEFNARLESFKDSSLSLSTKQLLQQSVILRYTDWVWGVAVYTGNETKLGMNKKKPHMKWTAAGQFIDRLSMFVFLFQLTTVIIFGAIGNYLSHYSISTMPYLALTPLGDEWYQSLIVPARFLLLCSMMIPISLKVTLDFVRAFYSKLINWDNTMYDEELKRGCISNNTGVSEDLGQIDVVLTDKTGTLTENKMAFKKCLINHGDSNVRYGDGDEEFESAFSDPALHQALNNQINKSAINFFRALALCHTVIPRKLKNGEFEYRSPSPDEEALVQAAVRADAKLLERNNNFVKILIQGKEESYEILKVLEFSSDRKRMSVVVKDLKTSEITLYIKGADDMILTRLRKDKEGSTKTDHDVEQTTKALEDFSSFGLRTLCIASKSVKAEDFKIFSEHLQLAEKKLNEREETVEKVYDLLEQNLNLLGVTAIEDKLQIHVPSTIATLRKAGIKFWMITGDKGQTALKIAISCNLHSTRQELISLEPQKVMSKFKDILENTLKICEKNPETRRTLLVGVYGFRQIFEHENLKKIFLKICVLCECVICCRVTPLQKAQIVHLAKQSGMRTLAIGDGGNDVNMIQEAHVGVGIEGREGQQAARAADYSVGKFFHLERLMLVHGHHSYHRTAFISQYSFYKSLMICFIQLTFATFSLFSGASHFNSLSLMSYNVFYTGLLPCFYVFDKNYEPETLISSPEKYSLTQKHTFLNKKTFFLWFIRAIFQALGIWVIIILSISFEFIGAQEGRPLSDEELSLVTFTALVLIQILTIVLNSNTLTVFNAFILIGTLIVFFLFNTGFSSVPTLSMYALMFHLYKEPVYWFTFILAVTCAMLPVYTIMGLKNNNNNNNNNKEKTELELADTVSSRLFTAQPSS